jgi:hypothetical protein
MAAISAAILVFFAFSEGGAQRQRGNCAMLGQVDIAAAWPYLEITLNVSWNPAFPASPPSLRRIGSGA